MSDVLSWLSSNLSLLIWAHFPSFSFTPRDGETQHPSQLPYTPRGTGGERVLLVLLVYSLDVMTFGKCCIHLHHSYLEHLTAFCVCKKGLLQACHLLAPLHHLRKQVISP